MNTKIYIAHFFTEYPDTYEHYSYASAHTTLNEARKAVEAEMLSMLDAQGIDEDEDTTAEKEIESAWEAGGEEHDAILEYGSGVKYCDITEANV